MPADPELKIKFDDSPTGLAARWQQEIESAEKRLEKYHRDAEAAVKRYLDEREVTVADKQDRLNLFWSDVQTREALANGNFPKVDVARRFADPQDEVARVGAEMLERLLNTDMERDGDSFVEAAGLALQERLIPGMGALKWRYVVETEQKTTPAVTHPETGEELAPEVNEEVKTFEDVESDFVTWKDQLWSKARWWSEVQWWAFRAYMTREDCIARFGEEIGAEIPLKNRGDKELEEDKDPWARAEVWEIWSKADRRVYWFVKGYPAILDAKDDPLGLEGFWPFPRPLLANATTRAFIPKPDYVMAQDLYRQVDSLETRIGLLTRALAVRGVYDKSNPQIARLIQDTAENELIPVDDWGMFAEKGGIKGAVDWLPLEQIVGTLDKLTQKQVEKISLLYQVTGMSDIMRGQATAAGTTATEQAAKVRFASVRSKAFEDGFARFISDAQRIRAEIISKHFDAKTIIERSNVLATPDAQMAMQGAQLIKERFPSYRIVVRPENVAQTDFAALKQERTELAAAFSQLAAAAPAFAQVIGPKTPELILALMQWMAAALRGSSTIEPIFDQVADAVKQAAMQPQPPPPPDPKLQAAQVKAQAEAQKAQMGVVQAHADTQAKVIAAKADIAKTAMQMQATAQKAALDQQAAAMPEPHLWGANAHLLPPEGQGNG